MNVEFILRYDMLLFIMKPHHTSCWVISLVHILNVHVFMAMETRKASDLRHYKCLSMVVSDQFVYVLTEVSGTAQQHMSSELPLYR